MGYSSNFLDGVSYGIDALNGIRKAFATKGVIPEADTSCKVVAGSTGKVVISTGQAMFEDGSIIVVDGSGVELTIIAGSKNYVWFKRDTVSNNATPQITTTSPAGTYVKLAEVAVDDTITDTREYGRVKVPSYDSTVSSSVIKSSNTNASLTGTTSWFKVDTVNTLIDFKRAVLSVYNVPGAAGVLACYDFTGVLNSDGYNFTFNLTRGESPLVAYKIGIKKVGTDLEVYVKPNYGSALAYICVVGGIFFV